MNEENLFWEHYPHLADMGIRGNGVTLEQAIENASLALSAIITDLSLIEPNEAIDICCEAPDQELLFVEYLNCLIYEMAVRQMLFSRFQIKINGTQMRAKVWGEKVNQVKHQPAVEVKGATYTDLKVQQLAPQQWQVQCVVDV